MASLDDESRLKALAESGLLNTGPDPKFDRFTQLATAVLGVPVSLLSLVSEDGQFFKSESGLPQPWREERRTPLTHSFCRHVVESEERLVFEDARNDEKLKDNLAVRDLNVVAYAGFPVSTPEGEVLGSFCAIDDRPRKWSIRELSILKGFAGAVESEIGLRLELQRRQEIEKKLELEVLARTAELSESLNQSKAVERRFRTLVERTPQAIAMLDRDLRYLHYSDRWVRDYKLQDKGPLVGLCHYDVFPGIPERWKSHHRRVLQGEALSCEEDSFLRENGVREWLRWELVPWHDSGGEVGGIIMLTQVLTERRIEQAELRRKYLELQEASKKLAQAQREGKLLHWSWKPALSTVKLENYRKQGDVEFTLEKLLEEVHPDYHALIEEKLKRGEASSDGVELEVMTVDDRILVLSGSWQDNHLTGVAQDVTELRNLKKQLRESQKMEALGLLASGVAHDLNNILCSILLPAELSKEELDPQHPVQEDLTIIQEAGKRAEALVRQLLLFARRSSTKPRIVDVNSIVKNFQGILNKLLPKRIQLKIALHDTPVPKVQIDPSALEQVLLNLLVNAKDAMPEGGLVTIQVGIEEPSSSKLVVLSVKDSGSGIPEEIRENIFAPFFTTKGVGEGTGLGLSVCASIVQEAGGQLRVDSTLGQGTTFRVELPYNEGTVAASVPAEDTVRVPGGSESILVVDDDDSIRRLVAKFLRSIGYNVTSFELASDALRALEREQQVELLLAEVHLPGLDGRELASESRLLHPSLKAVLMSADSSLKVIGEKNLFLPKPFGKSQLARIVREALDQPEE